MSLKWGTVAAGIALAAFVAAPQARAAGNALTQDERAMLRDAGAAERAVAARMDNARNSAATAQQGVVIGRDAAKSETSLRRVYQELEKAQRALESGNYKAAYVFAGRAETLAKGAAEVTQ